MCGVEVDRPLVQGVDHNHRGADRRGAALSRLDRIGERDRAETQALLVPRNHETTYQRRAHEALSGRSRAARKCLPWRASGVISAGTP
jgi:hypothetical protein